MSTQELNLQQSLILRMVLSKWSQPQYVRFREWLGGDSLVNSSRTIHLPLMQEFQSCLPKNSTSIHFYQMWSLAGIIQVDLEMKDQVVLAQYLGASQDMKARLTTVFASYLIPAYSPSTPVLENSTLQKKKHIQICRA